MSRKKQWPWTLGLAIAIGLLAVYCIYDIRRTKEIGDLGDNERRAVEAHQEDISELILKSPAQTYHLKKEAGVWKLTEPVQDDTDLMTVNMVLSHLTGAKLLKVSDDSEGAIAWEKYGFSPGIMIEVTSEKAKQGAQKETLTVSDKGAYDGSYYVRQGDHLYLGDRSWAQVVDKQLEHLRSHKIWRGEGDVTEIQLHYDINGHPENAKLSKTDKGLWIISPAMDLPISPDRVHNWITALHDVQMSSIVVSSPSPDDFKKDLLVKPTWSADLVLKKDDKSVAVQWKIGQDRDNDVSVFVSNRNEILKVFKSSLRDVRVPVEHFLDTSDLLKVKKEDVDEISMTAAGQTHKISKAETEAMTAALAKLKDLDPVPERAPAGLKWTSPIHIQVKGTGKPLLNLQWISTKEKIGWLKVGGVKELFKVSQDKLALLGQAMAPNQAPPPAKAGLSGKSQGHDQRHDQ